MLTLPFKTSSFAPTQGHHPPICLMVPAESISGLHISCDNPIIAVGMDGCPTKTFLAAETASYKAPVPPVKPLLA